jgi:hypothetical protein
MVVSFVVFLFLLPFRLESSSDGCFLGSKIRFWIGVLIGRQESK